MKKLDYSVLSFFFMVIVINISPPTCHAQQYASLVMHKKGLHQKAPDGATQSVEEESISLKEALKEIKSNYHVKFAYKEGLLDGKTVAQSLLKTNEYPLEVLLKNILTSVQLDFRRINEKQFTIFSFGDVTSHSKLNAEKIVDPISNEKSITDTESLPFQVSGTVTAKDDNQPLPGVSIILKNSGIGTTTGSDGKYSLAVPDGGGVLIFSFIGYTTKEIPVSNQSVIDVAMDQEATALGEVVITALGIEKSKSAIAYSVTEVKGDQFTQARENNVANALTGMIAGVNSTGLSTGPGGSSRVIIRGNGSLTGNSQPLYVINGMPIDNSVPGGSSQPNGLGITNAVDRGDGMGAINPDDIESITVLKGGTAAALYGSRGANGVVLITTKKGKAQTGVGVEYNSTFSMEKVSVFPDYQYEYGQGDGGVMPTNIDMARGSGRRSFGAKIDGNTNYVAADGLNHPYSAQKDNLKNFYETGNTFTNSLGLSGGNDAILYRLSFSDLKSNSILPNTTYSRRTANLNVSAKLTTKLRFESVITYSLEKGNNRPIAGDALGNPNWTPYEVANTVDVRWLKPGYDKQGNEIIWNDASIVTNSYFVVDKFKESDYKNRFIGQTSVSYDILKNLTLKGTVNRDFYNYNFTSILPTGTLYVPNGQYSGIKSDVSETNEMLTATYNTEITKKFGISVMAGANGRQFENKQLTLSGSNYIQPYFYSFSNLGSPSTRPYTGKIHTNSVFSSVDFDYKSLFFLTFTGRKDWFSTLSPSNNSIFYPSVGTSFVLSDAFRLPQVISVARLRASWAQVGGGGPDPYTINLTYSPVASTSNVPLQNVTVSDVTGQNEITNAKLKPFTSTTTELGLNVQLFDNHLGLDIAVYDRKSTNDIVKVPISSTSGYTSAYLNSGELSNKGIELLLTGSQMRIRNFTWNTSYNFAYNKSEVLKLADGITTFSLGNSANGNAYINNNVGRTFGAIYGYRMLKDTNGNVIYDTNSGLPKQTDINQELGKGVPPITMGLNNEIKYKNFTLSFLVDGKFGNKIFSVMEVYATRLGLLKSTLPGREEGLTLTGVTDTGAPYTRTVPVDQLRSGYYNSLNRYTELFVHDGSFVKLRQVIFSYRLPSDMLKRVGVQSASIAFVSRNLLTLYKKTVNFDPEQSLTNGAAQGIESIGLPRTRSYGLNLMLKF